MTLEIIPAAHTDATLLQNLFQLYTHDFSEFWSGLPAGELGEDGRFAPYPLDPFFERPRWCGRIFRADGALAGFALLNDEPHSGEPADHSMAEFFVVRKHRGQGFGRQAAQRLFCAAPGVWDVAIARRNVKALSFWRGAIADCPGASDIAEKDHAGPHWNGPIIRFRMTG